MPFAPEAATLVEHWLTAALADELPEAWREQYRQKIDSLEYTCGWSTHLEALLWHVKKNIADNYYQSGDPNKIRNNIHACRDLEYYQPSIGYCYDSELEVDHVDGKKLKVNQAEELGKGTFKTVHALKTQRTNPERSSLCRAKPNNFYIRAETNEFNFQGHLEILFDCVHTPHKKSCLLIDVGRNNQLIIREIMAIIPGKTAHSILYSLTDLNDIIEFTIAIIKFITKQISQHRFSADLTLENVMCSPQENETRISAYTFAFIDFAKHYHDPLRPAMFSFDLAAADYCYPLFNFANTPDDTTSFFYLRKNGQTLYQVSSSSKTTTNRPQHLIEKIVRGQDPEDCDDSMTFGHYRITREKNSELPADISEYIKITHNEKKDKTVLLRQEGINETLDKKACWSHYLARTIKSILLQVYYAKHYGQFETDDEKQEDLTDFLSTIVTIVEETSELELTPEYVITMIQGDIATDKKPFASKRAAESSDTVSKKIKLHNNKTAFFDRRKKKDSLDEGLKLKSE